MSAPFSKSNDEAQVYYCPRCRARNVGFGVTPPTCSACGLPLGPEDIVRPVDTRGRTNWVLSLGFVLALGFIVWQHRDQLGEPGLGLGSLLGLGGKSAEELSRDRSQAIQLCTATARARLGRAFEETPFAEDAVKLDHDGSYLIQSRPSDSDSLYGLTHAGFTCRVRQIGGEHGGSVVAEFTIQGDDPAPDATKITPTPSGTIRKKHRRHTT